MSKIKMTVQQIKDLGLWEKVCDYKGIDPRIYFGESKIVEFDTKFEDKDIIKNSIALEEPVLQSISYDIYAAIKDLDMPKIKGELTLGELEKAYKKLGDLLQRVKDNINSNKEE